MQYFAIIMKNVKFYIIILLTGVLSCTPPDDDDVTTDGKFNPIQPTAFTLTYPAHFDFILPPIIPEDNPLTEEGIALGKRLFFEKKLSKDNSISCGSCHQPANSFNDKGNKLSPGVNGVLGIRNAMPLFNLAWGSVTSKRFNWHGSAESLEEQAFEPVRNSKEMNETWINVVSKLQNDPTYPPMFERAFLTKAIDSNLVVKAIAQFERTLISGESRMDSYVSEQFAGINLPGENFLTDQEKRGFTLFLQESKGDCFHCHGSQFNPLWTNNEFVNNGLDAMPDSGLAEVTKLSTDLGKFKTPSLRNLEFTAPYMHDGRFNTLEEVVEFYNSGVEPNSPNLDGNQKPRNLTSQEQADLVAFLRALTDTNFVNNPDFRP